MGDGSDSSKVDTLLSNVMEATIRIGVLLLLAAWCFQIVKPFITPVVWAVIIAVAVYPAYEWLLQRLGGRRTLASGLFTLAALLMLIGPTVLLSKTVVENAQQLAAVIGEGGFEIPPPPDRVAEWPVVGGAVHKYWAMANENLAQLLELAEPQIVAFSRWLIGAVAGGGIAVAQFVLAILIAGILMARSDHGHRAARAIGRRLAGDQGDSYVALSGTMVRSVARGILGVAIIQSALAFVGFLAVDLPGAGLLALLCLVLAVIQVGPFVILIPAVAYVFSTASTLTTVVFAVWCLFVGLIDNVLKPLLLGRGVKVPMVVIFIGAIGGFLSMGIIGLFVGAVVLVFGYTLLLAWLDDGRLEGIDAPAAPAEDAVPS